MTFAVDTEWVRDWNSFYDFEVGLGLDPWNAAKVATIAVTPDFPVEKMGFDLLCKKRGWK